MRKPSQKKDLRLEVWQPLEVEGSFEELQELAGDILAEDKQVVPHPHQRARAISSFWKEGLPPEVVFDSNNREVENNYNRVGEDSNRDKEKRLEFDCL